MGSAIRGAGAPATVFTIDSGQVQAMLALQTSMLHVSAVSLTPGNSQAELGSQGSLGVSSPSQLGSSNLNITDLNQSVAGRC